MALMSWGSLQLTHPTTCGGERLSVTGELAPAGFLPVFKTRAEAEAFKLRRGPKFEAAEIVLLVAQEG